MDLSSVSIRTPPSNTALQRTSPASPVPPPSFRPLGRTGRVITIGSLVLLLGSGCRSSGAPPESGAKAPGKWVLAYQLPDGTWRNDVEDVAAPVLARRVEPLWPLSLRSPANTGVVVMRVLVSRAGSVEEVIVTEHVSKPMDDEAVKAVRGWGYRPATLHGEPVPVWLRVTVTFRLS